MSEEDMESKAKKKKAKIHTHCTEEQQEDMEDWLKMHKVRNNKKFQNYKDTTKKAFLWWMSMWKNSRSGT